MSLRCIATPTKYISFTARDGLPANFIPLRTTVSGLPKNPAVASAPFVSPTGEEIVWDGPGFEFLYVTRNEQYTLNCAASPAEDGSFWYGGPAAVIVPTDRPATKTNCTFMIVWSGHPLEAATFHNIGAWQRKFHSHNTMVTLYNNLSPADQLKVPFLQWPGKAPRIIKPRTSLATKVDHYSRLLQQASSGAGPSSSYDPVSVPQSPGTMADLAAMTWPTFSP